MLASRAEAGLQYFRSHWLSFSSLMFSSAHGLGAESVRVRTSSSFFIRACCGTSRGGPDLSLVQEIGGSRDFRDKTGVLSDDHRGPPGPHISLGTD